MTIVYILIAIIMLGVLIFVHELGHYLVGRMMNIGINEFAIGMGPKLFSRQGTHKIKVNGNVMTETTTYSLRLLPLGGFCAFVGEDEEDADPRAMNKAPAWKRLLTVAAGPLMNILIAFLIGVVLIYAQLIPDIFNTEHLQNRRVYFTQAMEDMPAASARIEGLEGDEAMLTEGDEITAVNGISLADKGVAGLKAELNKIGVGGEATLTLVRNDSEMHITIPLAEGTDGSPMLGVSLGETAEYPEYDCNLPQAVIESFVLMKNITVETYSSLIDLLGKVFKREAIPEGSVSGVVGIVSNVSSTLQVGFGASFSGGVTYIFLYLMLISISLGLMNLLPLPALDGGRLVLLLIEVVTGKHFSRKTEGIINLVGLALLLGLMLLVTFFDVKALFK